MNAQLAERALVQVLGDDLDAVRAGSEDVDRAHLLELGRHFPIAGDGLVDFHVDEHRLAQTRAPIRSLTISGISAISSATVIPASARRAICSVAVSSLPSTIVPAWPKLIPGISSMNLPAMNATIGSRESCSVTHRASAAPILPPGSV